MTKVSHSVLLELVVVTVLIVSTFWGCQSSPPREIRAAKPPISILVYSEPSSDARAPVQVASLWQFHDAGIAGENTSPEQSLFDALIAPLANEAKRRRAEFAKTDPEYSKRVDRELTDLLT